MNNQLFGAILASLALTGYAYNADFDQHLPMNGECYPNSTGLEDWECLTNDCENLEWREKKSALAALLLHIFLGQAGGAYWYYGYWALAAVNLTLLLSPCICCCLMMCGLGAMLTSASGGSTHDGVGDYGSVQGSGSGAPAPDGSGSAAPAPDGSGFVPLEPDNCADPEGPGASSFEVAATGSGSGAGSGANGEGQSSLAAIGPCCASCGLMIWWIIVIVQVVQYEIYPQENSMCLIKNV